MKNILLLIRWLVGLLFIFSGLIKANDPLGLSYKMQEFFEAWNLQGFHNYTLWLAIGMNTLEVVAGVAVIIGWQMKRVSWLLLLLILFFTFLTSYVLFSGKIHACGCFGDCVPLTPIQTFVKDIILLLLILILFFKVGDVKPMFNKITSIALVSLSFIFVLGFQFYVQKYLPLLDCLPYAKGKNIVEGMQLPKGAVADSSVITFKYKKNGKEMEFDQNNFPEDFDSTYEFVDRFDKLIRKGTSLPKIVDFSLTTLTGNDTTQAILAQENKYILLFVKDFNNITNWKASDMGLIIDAAKAKNIPVFLVTADATAAQENFSSLIILKTDATVIKTAARVNPTYFIMQKGNVLAKYSYANAKKILNDIK